MLFDQRLGKRQAQPGTFIGTAIGGMDQAEGFEGLRNVARVDADPRIRDLQSQPAIGAAAGADRDLAMRLGEFDRVGQEIEHDLLQSYRIGPEYRQAGLDLEPEPEPAANQSFA